MKLDVAGDSVGEDFTIQLIPGAKYFAGFSRPFFISDALIREKIAEMGGSNVQFFERETSPPAFDPRQDSEYEDDWDEWLSADYTGPRTEVTVDRKWKWGLRKTPRPEDRPAPTSPGPQLPTPSSAPSASAGSVVLGALFAAGLGWLLFGRRR